MSTATTRQTLVVEGSPSSAAFTNMRRLRKARRWSAQFLADTLTSLGLPISRSVIANQENGYVESMPLDQAVALAKLFGMQLAHLIVPCCEVCADSPPTGFTCNTCGMTADKD